VMVSGIVYVLMGSTVHDSQLSLIIIKGSTGALITIDRVIMFLILLKVGCKVAARWLQGVYMLRMTPTKSFL